MTQEEIIEGNKLIGVFEGYELRAFKVENNREYFLTKQGVRLEMSELKYHSSWDWQIPVWGKVALAVKTLMGDDENKRHLFVDEYYKILDRYENAIYLNQPEKGQALIVALIKWHNQNQ